MNQLQNPNVYLTNNWHPGRLTELARSARIRLAAIKDNDVVRFEKLARRTETKRSTVANPSIFPKGLIRNLLRLIPSIYIWANLTERVHEESQRAPNEPNLGQTFKDMYGYVNMWDGEGKGLICKSREILTSTRKCQQLSVSSSQQAESIEIQEFLNNVHILGICSSW